MEKNSLAANVTYQPDDANRANCNNAPKTIQLVSSSSVVEFAIRPTMCMKAMPRSKRALQEHTTDNVQLCIQSLHI